MPAKNSLVLYKNNAAIITDREGDKYIVKYCTQPATATGKKAVYAEQKIRDKDFILLSEDPVSSLDNVIALSKDYSAGLEEARELFLSDDQSSQIPLGDLMEMAAGEVKGDEIFCFFNAVRSSLLFSLDDQNFKNGSITFSIRSDDEIAKLKKEQDEKEHAGEIRAAFISRLKEKKLNLPEDAVYMGDVEALALGKIDKSKTLAEAGFSQTPEKAHRLLIDTGIWPETKNPHPTRFGFSFASAKETLGAVPDEERMVLDHKAYAIDSEWSSDPDDAISWDGEYLWVHIADPACYVLPDSPIDKAARDRGTTLYIPEGASRMLCEECLEDYALGLKEWSVALSFKLKLTETCEVESCEVIKTKLKVERLTYKYADEHKDSPELKVFFEIARKNIQRRNSNGAVSINFPEVHISVDKETKKVSLESDEKYESNSMICEMMLLAGEGAARFAFKNGLPFPYVSQEAPDLPENVREGYAGQLQILKKMHKRSVGITPSPHAGLGLSFYSQVTSPLRRYGDLIAHEQLRAFLDKRRTLTKDEMLERIAAGDAASIAAKKASRLSDTHWKLVYLLQNPQWTGDAYCIDIKGNDRVFLIPELDMQGTIALTNEDYNDCIKVRAVDIDMTTQTVNFIKV
ncbi:MAG: RNB domain-containing ribonuclease [Treponema sp.]|nr:RNB domain-containing ribonuclease [Treponema sp.]